MTAIAVNTQDSLMAGGIANRGLALVGDLAAHVAAIEVTGWDATGDRFGLEVMMCNGQLVGFGGIDFRTGKGPYQVARWILGVALAMSLDTFDRELQVACAAAKASLVKAHSAWVDSLLDYTS